LGLFFCFQSCEIKILVKIPIKLIHEGQKKQFFGHRKFSKIFIKKKNILGKLGGALGIYWGCDLLEVVFVIFKPKVREIYLFIYLFIIVVLVTENWLKIKNIFFHNCTLCQVLVHTWSSYIVLQHRPERLLNPKVSFSH
jgi:hypothetical protein